MAANDLFIATAVVDLANQKTNSHVQWIIAFTQFHALDHFIVFTDRAYTGI
jgi:hypothetical protein